MNDCRILVGTSGYSFADWVGAFYPPNLPRGKMLDYYKDHFKTVEINSSYYRIPHASVFYHLSRKVPDDFEFMVKTHRSFTHDRKNVEENIKALLKAVEPLRETGKLSGFLAQFPWSYKFSQTNLNYILDKKENFGDIGLYVEFRHDSWNSPEVFEALRRAEIGICCVDEPALEHLFPPVALATTRVGYIRFHGRNSTDWWHPRPGRDRYDYAYEKSELADWIKRIDRLRRETEKIFVFFNNCHLGQAVRNAKMLIEMIQVEFGDA